MRPNVLRTWWPIFLLLALPCTAWAEVRAELAWGAPGRPLTWELLRVTTPRPADAAGEGELTVVAQDARGGPMVERPLDELADDGRMLAAVVPLPLVAPAQLPGGQWAVEFSVRLRGKEIEHARIELAIGDTGSPAVFRIIVPRGDGSDVAGDSPLWWQEVQGAMGRPVSVTQLPAREILEDSPLLFGACDALLLTPDLYQQLSEKRSASLINAGVRLIAISDTAPAGTLSHLVWDRLQSPPSPDAAPALWISPSQPLRRPTVIEAGLQAVLRQEPPMQPPASVRAAVVLTGPAALIIMLLARGLFRRRAVLLATASAGLVALTSGTIAYLRAQDETAPHQATWEVVAAGSEAPIGAIASTETLSIWRPLFSRQVHVTVPDGAVLTPVAAGPRDYFALRDLRVAVGLRTSTGEIEPDALDARLSARQTVAYMICSTTLGGWADEARGGKGGLIPPFPATEEERRRFEQITHTDLAAGWWLEGGYVFPGAASEQERQAKGELFTTWTQRLGIAGANAWYELALTEATATSSSRSQAAQLYV